MHAADEDTSTTLSAEAAWQLLQLHLQRLVGRSADSAGLMGLPVAVAHAILGADSRTKIPSWLEAFFMVRRHVHHLPVMLTAADHAPSHGSCLMHMVEADSCAPVLLVLRCHAACCLQAMYQLMRGIHHAQI